MLSSGWMVPLSFYFSQGPLSPRSFGEAVSLKSLSFARRFNPFARPSQITSLHRPPPARSRRSRSLRQPGVIRHPFVRSEESSQNIARRPARAPIYVRRAFRSKCQFWIVRRMSDSGAGLRLLGVDCCHLGKANDLNPMPRFIVSGARKLRRACERSKSLFITTGR